jgi:hypothetical protein
MPNFRSTMTSNRTRCQDCLLSLGRRAARRGMPRVAHKQPHLLFFPLMRALFSLVRRQPTLNAASCQQWTEGLHPHHDTIPGNCVRPTRASGPLRMQVPQAATAHPDDIGPPSLHAHHDGRHQRPGSSRAAVRGAPGQVEGRFSDRSQRPGQFGHR